MHRDRLKARLAAYRRRWPEESETVARFEAFIDPHPDCFKRSCTVGHITGSAWIVSSARDRVLLTHHRKLGRWLQPGRHSDGDPDTLEVGLREAREESGLEVRALDEAIFDLDVHLIPGSWRRNPPHYHYDVRFLVQALVARFRVPEASPWTGARGTFTACYEPHLHDAATGRRTRMREDISEYDRRAIAEIHQWKTPELSWFGQAMRAIDWPLAKASDWFLDQPLVGEAIRRPSRALSVCAMTPRNGPCAKTRSMASFGVPDTPWRRQPT